MNIIYNGEKLELSGDASVISVIEKFLYNPSDTVVWLNGRQLLAAEYNSTPLSEGDDLNLFRVIGGG